MENASKALIIAGSVLISMLVIGAVVFLYVQLSNLEQTKVDSEASEKVVEYGKKFEQYNKSLYGSEILSLANLQEDYNKTQVDELGYQEIKITVNITRPVEVEGYTYFSSGNQDIEDVLNGNTRMRDIIEDMETDRKYKGKTVKYYSQKSYREIALVYGTNYSSLMSDGDIKMELEDNATGEIKELVDAIETYKLLKSSYTEFKNKKFNCTKIDYDKYNGRICELAYKEI